MGSKGLPAMLPLEAGGGAPKGLLSAIVNTGVVVVVSRSWIAMGSSNSASTTICVGYSFYDRCVR